MEQRPNPGGPYDNHQAATSQTGSVTVRGNESVAAMKKDGAAVGEMSIGSGQEHGTLSANAAAEVKAVLTSVGKSDMNLENQHDAVEEYARRIAGGNVGNGTRDQKQATTAMSMKDDCDPHRR